MTSKERMLIAMMNGQPDMVPVAPDMSNMIPCKLTGKPFWDIYLYQDPPLWKAYIDAVRFFGFDGWLPGVPVDVDYDLHTGQDQPQWKEAIVHTTPERIYTRMHIQLEGDHQWSDFCHVYYIADPPTHHVRLSKVGLPAEPPTSWEDVVPRTSYSGVDAYYAASEYMGDAGVVGIAEGLPGLGLEPESMYEWYDNPDAVRERCQAYHEQIVRRTKKIVKIKPDFLLLGVSGFMISNPEPIFRELALPTLKEVTAICKAAGVPSQLHCCGPEYSLVKMAALETDLSNINPLEVAPMGDCDLARVKREFGHKISLMGNLHTTSVMLHGSPQKVADESRKAIDAAAAGGGFILSTGDQCGRDTPFDNIHAMIDTARNYFKY
ncbi:MAG: uroporphyrinogen decarboxylase family protein [Armatimonadota bacterium]